MKLPLTIVVTVGVALFLGLGAAPVAGQTAFNVNAGLSGAWFDPAKAFQGYFFQVLDARTALVTWFTYEPSGRQAYLIGVGAIEGNRVVIRDLIKTRGGRFGTRFDPAAVVREDWGDLVLTFSGCDRGRAEFTPSQPGWPAETLNLTRLTTIRGLPCPASEPPAAKYLHGGISGAWFPTGRSGEGWLVEVLDASNAFVYWFSYDPDGNQAWFGNTGRIVDGSIVIDNALQPTGGLFGPNYNPNQVRLNPWGAFVMTFTGANSAVVAASGPPNFGDVDYPSVERITALAGTNPGGFTVGRFALTGTVTAPAHSAVDGDLNDPNAPNRDNDTVAQAQAVTGPVSIVGYATGVATGRGDDRFAAAADPSDYFRVALARGQTLRLAIADHDPSAPTRVDHDLFLTPPNDDRTAVASSEGVGALEQLTVPADGQYLVIVDALGRGSNYLLSIDTAPAASSVPGQMSSLLPMETDTLILGLIAPGGTGAAEDRAKARAELEHLGLELAAGALGQPVLARLGGATARNVAKHRLGMTLPPHANRFADPALKARRELVLFAKALAAQPGVRHVSPNLLRASAAEPNDPLYRLQWHYPLIKLPQAWDITTGNPNVVGAVIDSGVVPHPDFGSNLRFDLGFDFISSTLSSRDGDGIDGNADDPGDAFNPDGSSTFHGTHVAGTMAAASNNGSGAAGVAWQATLMPVRVLGSRLPGTNSTGTDFDILQGMLWSAGLPNASGRTPGRRADVVNLSLGGPGSCPQVYAETIARIRAAGSIVITAAGNAASGLPFTPASCPGTVNVSAIDLFGARAPYSNFGPTIDVAAPGGDTSVDRDANGIDDGVVSLLATGELQNRRPSFGVYQGTSMAAPHVAGIAMLMKAVNPNLRPEQFDQLLASGRITIDIAGNGPTVRDDTYGFGVIDAFRAVAEARALLQPAPLPAALVATPVTIDFGETLGSAVLTLANAGQGPLTVSSVTGTQPWISVARQTVDAQGLGTYVVSVNRAGLANAAFQGQVRIASSAGQASVQIALRVGSRPTGDLGPIYVLAVDAQTGIALRQAVVAANAGRYPYTIANNLPGDYLLFAGTDLDNDGFICDAGEACGAFAALSRPSVVRLDGANLALPAFVANPDDALFAAPAAGAAKALRGDRAAHPRLR